MTTQTRTMADYIGADDAHEVTPETFLTTGPLVAPEGGDPSGMSVTDLEYKGYVPIWDTKTGVSGLALSYLLFQTMKMRHPDGTVMYTLTDPGIAQNHGEDLFCPLNPDAPDHAQYAGMGFRPCRTRKRHIPTQSALDLHVRYSHKRAYEAIAKRKAEMERAEDRAIALRGIESTQQLMAAIVGQATQSAPRLKHSHGAPWDVKREGCPACEA